MLSQKRYRRALCFIVVESNYGRRRSLSARHEVTDLLHTLRPLASAISLLLTPLENRLAQ